MAKSWYLLNLLYWWFCITIFIACFVFLYHDTVINPDPGDILDFADWHLWWSIGGVPLMCDPQNHPKPGFNTKVVVFFGYVMVLHHVTSLYILDHFEIPHLLVYVFSRLGNFLFFLTGKHTKSYRCFLLNSLFFLLYAKMHDWKDRQTCKNSWVNSLLFSVKSNARQILILFVRNQGSQNLMVDHHPISSWWSYIVKSCQWFLDVGSVSHYSLVKYG